jgi:hypothetical protein
LGLLAASAGTIGLIPRDECHPRQDPRFFFFPAFFAFFFAMAPIHYPLTNRHFPDQGSASLQPQQAQPG